MNYFSMRYGCEVGLTVFDGASIIHIISVGENISFGMQPTPGQVCPVYCTAAGKFHLAQMEQDALMEWIAKARIVPHTRNTIIDRDELLQEIVRTRSQGYGVAVGELYDMLASVAFPIRDGGRRITGTINLNFSVEKFRTQMSQTFVQEGGRGAQAVRRIKRETRYGFKQKRGMRTRIPRFGVMGKTAGRTARPYSSR